MAAGTWKLQRVQVSPFNFAIATPSLELISLENLDLFTGERDGSRSLNLFL